MSPQSVSQMQTMPEAKTIAELSHVLGNASPEHLLWISGYCYGLAQQASPAANVLADSGQQRIWVIYGSQTGNSRSVAETLVQAMENNQATVSLKSMADLQPRQLKKCDALFAVVSTQGEGEPPEQAMAFFEALESERAPDLSHLEYAVLGLGDSSYEYFCETGKQLDQRLEVLKARRLFERIDADIDFQQQSLQWTEQILDHVENNQQAAENSSMPKPELKLVSLPSVYSRTHPFNAQLLTNQLITGRSSNKSVHHLELDITDSGMVYQPGDSLGVRVKNSEQQVAQILQVSKLGGEIEVTVNGKSISVAKALAEQLEITRLHPKTFQNYAVNNQQLAAQIASGKRETLLALSQNYQLIDLLMEYPADVDEQQLVDLLLPKVERLYSIASSPDIYSDEIHLTVAAVDYQKNNQSRYGTGSHYLNQAQPGDELAVYLQENQHFRLPDDQQTPVIMVGPGTGIAPFRAFMQHRQAHASTGKNWLFFGNPHFHSDFLYQLEWQKLLKDGILDRMDVAFSRDQKQKIYVQDRIIEQAAGVYDWLEQGAVFYICGDASGMAKAVEKALLEVIISQSGKDIDFAKDYLSQMKTGKRLLKDVY